uniref:Uncharacterized protein n=1 Tax=Chenopodium quinoa TaxID=63459 RepID=A0A803N923_CHEQI
MIGGYDWWQRNEKVGDAGRGGGFCVREQQGVGRIGVAMNKGCGLEMRCRIREGVVKMVQALLCTQDWLRAKEVPIVDVEENLKELEEIEKEVQRGESNDVDDEVVFVDSLV